MTYPIAMIPYANMAPFQELGPPDGCRFVRCLPRDSIQALVQKEVWAAAVPVGGLASLEGEVTLLGPFGIATQKESMSVLFFSDHPFDAFCRPLTLHLTAESATSVRLLYLLLGYEHGFEATPLRAGPGMAANGHLVIGDTALQWVRKWERDGAVQGYRYITDLAFRWYARHQLPFVFARWVVHRQAPEQVKAVLEQWLQAFAVQEPVLIQQAVPKVARRMGLPTEYVARYLKIIRRCLTPEEEKGQLQFRRELERHACEPLFSLAQKRVARTVR